MRKDIIVKVDIEKERIRDLRKAESEYKQHENTIAEIDRLINMKLSNIMDRSKLIGEYLSWLDEVESGSIDGVKEIIIANQYREAFNNPRPTNIFGEIDPHQYMNNLKNVLEGIKASEKTKLEANKMELKNDEAQLLSIKYGRDSVRLTKQNILYSITIPLGIIIISFLLEALKPEITNIIRTLFGLK